MLFEWEWAQLAPHGRDSLGGETRSGPPKVKELSFVHSWGHQTIFGARLRLWLRFLCFRLRWDFKIKPTLFLYTCDMLEISQMETCKMAFRNYQGDFKRPSLMPSAKTAYSWHYWEMRVHCLGEAKELTACTWEADANPRCTSLRKVSPGALRFPASLPLKFLSHICSLSFLLYKSFAEFWPQSNLCEDNVIFLLNLSQRYPDVDPDVSMEMVWPLFCWTDMELSLVQTPTIQFCQWQSKFVFHLLSFPAQFTLF